MFLLPPKTGQLPRTKEYNFAPVRYDFEVGGTSYFGKTWTSSEFEHGQEVDVYYEPGDPAKNCLTFSKDAGDLVFALILASVFGAVGVVLLANELLGILG